MPPLLLTRRRFHVLAAAAVFAPAVGARAQGSVAGPFIADVHSHLGMLGRTAGLVNLRREMEESGTSLLAWAIVDDVRWITAGANGIVQSGRPAPGELRAAFGESVRAYDAALARWHLPKVLAPADVDAALGGAPHVVMACESANFLEGDARQLAHAHAMGLRHLQIVHYIESPLGDLQTSAPRHHGMPPLAREVLGECGRLGILVDLAHCTGAFVDAALEAGGATMIWSHSWISARAGRWNDWPYLARALSPAHARKIAAHGGLVGLWSVRARDPAYPVRDVRGYADEILRMVDEIGPRAVAFGTDMDGAGPSPALAGLRDLREVVNLLARRGLSQADLQALCIGNYARVLRTAMKA
jgi:membrane dipeptidase